MSQGLDAPACWPRAGLPEPIREANLKNDLAESRGPL